ncbi:MULTISPECIES: 4'-phosphopantetheinyl transferase family protein [Streptomyces]|uniref:4'-phosphopantetheinyl transferase EntD (Siderophore biosynthesis) n=2 Tax=Streptomyces TaxID=1883 RepID=A0A1I6P3R6_9ACTN|nr:MULTISPECIES: 4'-phosphopantetheinyl transferase superfamily protein [Streptomyces]SFS34843.1 4'-phosphopantetheinyl transferase EntD (siderophore biosynthesis) [Streptomyces harbinensis]
MIAELLPREVSAVEMFGDPDGTPDLFPEEAAVVARAVPKRRQEFATVRACARTALERIGGPRVPLLPGERGAPGWPPGFIGSMTHCTGYRAAVVAAAGRGLASLGVDAEPHEALRDPGVVEMVTLPGEREHLAKLAASHPRVRWERLLFSAKESVYKAWFPLTGRWLGFEEARIAFDPDAGAFTAELLVPGPVVDGVPIRRFAGRWLVRDGLLVTAIAVPAPRPVPAGGITG